MKNQQQPHLAIIPSVPVWATAGKLCFDRKFYDGMLSYCEQWPGTISCLIPLATTPMGNFGNICINPSELPFRCTILHQTEKVTAAHLKGADIVLAGGDDERQLHLAELCQKAQIPCVYIIEYIPETRYQIMAMSTTNPVRRLRRQFHVWQQERRRVKAFRLSAGLQSNGTPAFNHYAQSTNRLLYFDTRVATEQMISEQALNQRLAYLAESKPLRLAFSGRLIRMKGADHLVKLALRLKQQEVPFLFTIYGSGDLDHEMRDFICQNQLEQQVILTGAVDFYGELLPALQHSADLFICLHRQSDPSCTYLETLACGVPILGYNNQAFSGLLERDNIGWSTDMDNINGIARTIAHLHRQRDEIAERAKQAVCFARQHDFQTTFKARIDHLRALT